MSPTTVPGQLVGYPIVAVPRLPRGFDIVGHVRRLEEMLIGSLADLGIEAWAEAGFTGVWTSAGKVAAIGVRVARGVSMHGFALNVDTDLDYFGHIVPCGIPDRPVTSVSKLLDRPVSLEEAVEALIPYAVRVLAHGAAEVQLGAFARGSRKKRYERRCDGRSRRVLSAGSQPRFLSRFAGLLPGEPERPEWMRVRASTGSDGYQKLKALMGDLELNTVCEEAKCPNIYECWGQGTATLMLLGDKCTRACAFCDVATGRPDAVDLGEPTRAAQAVTALGLRHAVLTSVNRDDLPDGGAGIFAETIRRIRDIDPECDVEVLIPDFKGDAAALETVMGEKPAVLNHNTETVLRLQRDIRTAASYGRSLALLSRAKWLNPSGTVKSGLIVGMGETEPRSWVRWQTSTPSALISSPSANTCARRGTTGQSIATSRRRNSRDTATRVRASAFRTSNPAPSCARRTTLAILWRQPRRDSGDRLRGTDRPRPREMSAGGIDILLLCVGRDLLYLTGYEALPLERMTMAVVPLEGAVTLVVPELEAPRVQPRPGVFTIRPWAETEDPVEIVSRLAGSPDIVAIGDHTWASFVLGLQQRVPRARFIPAHAISAALRMRKSTDETALLRAAGAAADRVAVRLAEIEFAGTTEADLARTVARMM